MCVSSPAPRATAPDDSCTSRALDSAVQLQPPCLPITTKHASVRPGSCGPPRLTLPPLSAPSPEPLPCRPEGSTPKQELPRGPCRRHPAQPQGGQGHDRRPWTVQRGIWTAAPAPHAPAPRASRFLTLPAPPDLRAVAGALPASTPSLLSPPPQSGLCSFTHQPTRTPPCSCLAPAPSCRQHPSSGWASLAHPRTEIGIWHVVAAQ